MEGLSNAAGVVAVVSITTDILAGIARLYTLYQSIKDAPQDINSILRDLHQLSTTLHYIEEQQKGLLDDTIKTPLLTCKQKIGNLHEMIQALSVALQSRKGKKRLWTSCKAVLRKDRIISLRQSLEETKNTMILVLVSRRDLISLPTKESYTLTRLASKVQDIEGQQGMLQNGTDGILKNLSDLEGKLLPQLTTISSKMSDLEYTIHKINSPPYVPGAKSDSAKLECFNYSKCSLSAKPCRRQKHVSIHIPFYIPTPFGSIDFQFQIETGDATIEIPSIQLMIQKTISLVWHPMSWAIRLGSAFATHILVMRCQSGWKHVLSPVRSVSDISPVFSLCQDGNINAVRELISRGGASVSDTDSYGRQPLHFALMGQQLEMSRFLLENGADKFIRTFRGCTLLGYTTLASPHWMEYVLLLEDLVDFSTAESNGWQLLRGFYVSDHEYSISFCLEWLFTRHLCAGFESLNFRSLYHSYLAAVMRNDCKAVNLILNLCPHISDHRRNLATPLQLLLDRPNNAPEMFKALIDSGEDLHQIQWHETASSKAMKYWTSFRAWRSQLKIYYQSFHSILTRETDLPEMPLRRQGWSFDGLQRLFNLPFRSTVTVQSDSSNCYYCKIEILDIERDYIFVDPWWEHLLDRIKKYQCICQCLKTSAEWLDASGKSSIQNLCGVHVSTQSDEYIYSQNDQATVGKVTTSTCEHCSTLEITPVLQLDVEISLARPPKVSLDNNKLAEIWFNIPPLECLYGYKECEPSSPISLDTGSLHPGSRNRVHTSDWEASSGMIFPSRKEIMTQFVKRGGWTKRYLPGHLYCFHCISMFENWAEELGCGSAQVAEHMSPTMPGAFPT